MSMFGRRILASRGSELMSHAALEQGVGIDRHASQAHCAVSGPLDLGRQADRPIEYYELKREIEESFARLQLEVVDLMQHHYRIGTTLLRLRHDPEASHASLMHIGFRYLTVQVFDLPAADSLDEISEIIAFIRIGFNIGCCGANIGIIKVCRP